MPIEPFVLERFFARHEFAARHLLSPSDCETLTQAELLGMADAQARGLWNGLRLGYTESTGHPLLKREIASLHRGISPEEVLVAAPEEAIFIAMNCLLQAGDRVVAVSPAYQSLQSSGHLLHRIHLLPVLVCCRGDGCDEPFLLCRATAVIEQE